MGVVNRVRWMRFQRDLERRWQGWDRRGGGRFADTALQPYEALRRPTFDPLADGAPCETALRGHLDRLPLWNQPSTDSVHVITKRCFIEPEDGFVILDSGEIFPESVGWAERHREPELHQFFGRVPSESEFDAARMNPSTCRSIPRCVSLRFLFDHNYGHALVQLLPALLLLDELGIDRNVPVLVARRLASQEFFQELIQRGRFADRTWIVSDDRWVVSDEVIVPRIDWPSPEILQRFLDDLDVTVPDDPGERRLFVERTTRTFSNQDRVNQVLRARGYEGVRPEQLSFAGQVDLFANASVVAGATGSGLVNIMFRRARPASLLEIARVDWRDPFFHRLSAACGAKYQLMVGPQLVNDTVTVDLDELDALLARVA
jgi:capsular polysaccharide biosynthesis protein